MSFDFSRWVRRWFARKGGEESMPAQNADYDRETIEVMRRVLRLDSSGIDIGAHTGLILEQMLLVAPRGLHYAFEPLPHLAAMLRSKFPLVQVHEAAVSDRTGNTTFVHVENDPAYSGLQPRVYDRPDPQLRTISVEVVRLDDVIPDAAEIDFIKLDIEGGEFLALRGAARLIARRRPVIVSEAGAKSTGQYGVEPEQLYQLITSQFGYHLSTMGRWLVGAPPYDETAFVQNWHAGPDFYFIAYPSATSGDPEKATGSGGHRPDK